MKHVTVPAAVTAAVLALTGVAVAESPRDKASGGGQILVSSDGKGAGDTLAFTAQNLASTGTAAKGQLQYQDRTGGTGKGHASFHGTVTCLSVAGNAAQVAGKLDSGDNFKLYVVDNGQGAAAEDDMVVYDGAAPDTTCDVSDRPDEDDFVALSRGNYQVKDAGAQAASKRRAARLLR